MDVMPSLPGIDTPRWPIVIRHDPEHDCLISSYRGCSMRTREDVNAFIAGFYVELRRHSTPSALIAIYDGMYVAPDIVRYYSGGRLQAAARVGAPIYRVAATPEARLYLPHTDDPRDVPVSYPSLQAAYAQLARDRIKAR